MPTETNQTGIERHGAFQKEAIPHLDSVYNMAIYLTRNPSEAEDLVQETMLRAYRFFHQYQPGTNCKAWLLRILKNTFINQYRKATSRPSQVNLENVDEVRDREESNYGSTEILDPREALFQNLYDDEVTEALEKLPEEFREALLLSDVEGLTYQEIADVLDIPLGTVRSRLSRGRRMMRTFLMDYARKHGIVRSEADLGSSGEDNFEESGRDGSQ